MSEGRIILINKPYRWTSFDVVKYIRKALGGEKTGHAGTLDPLATGLLILCTGKMTRRIQEIQNAEKEYTGTITIGAVTDSFDLETPPVGHRDFSGITSEAIDAAAKSFTGDLMQTPPAHSAVKVSGRRAYALARKDEAVELKTKPVHISEFEITAIDLPEIHFRVRCSKGTYIRSLANDFGQTLTCGAYLSSLCRIRIGDYLLNDAIEPAEFSRKEADKERVT